MPDKTILVCQGTGCVSAKSDQIYEALGQEVSRLGLSDVRVDFTGCHGFCQRGPIVVVEPEGVFYSQVAVEDASEIVESHLRDGKLVERLFYRDPVTDEAIAHYRDITFYARQQRIILRNCGHINPENIDDYLAVGGYEALRRVVSKVPPEEVIKEVTRSGLRGLGGAGFPTGRKWDGCRRACGGQKYVICNADEGDPGAFQDRSILEGDPHSVLEGMIIAGYAVGAGKGYIYVRAEYPLAVKRLEIAIRQAKERGFIGEGILGTDNRGMPKTLPRPRTTEEGLWGKPTLLNNVKTFANIRWIISKGADWFAGVGTEKCKVSLTGKIANCGLIEVPMGITLREIIFDIGGGISGGRVFKAVQTGGPSGGCLPPSLLDIAVDFDSLATVGAIMGSGGMVVMDDGTCMVDVARYFLDFTEKESCGQCSLCRLGSSQMLEILRTITAGKGKMEDIDLLGELGEAIKIGSICGLGQTAPNPVLTTIRYFREEYEAHIHERQCPSLVCRELISYHILPDKCKACMICLRECPAGAITGGKKQVHVIDQGKCIRCGVCMSVCPERFSAVECTPGRLSEGDLR
jgi:NADH:ubiquinone oxidoreductase subunit F (NADH-binding)/(2Fe-2S) ferredoxin/NAD-dependent dihydropyrimidine dehydrogenase PreA subunit